MKQTQNRTLEGDAEAEEAEDRLDYVVIFENLSKGKTRDILEQIAETRKLVDQPPTSFSRLRRRALERCSLAFCRPCVPVASIRAKVEVDIDRDTSPITITYKFDVGPRYDIGKVTIELNPPTEDDIDLPSPKKLNLIEGKRASSIKVIEAESELLERVRKQGFANAELGPRTIVVDHNTAQMDITFSLNPGPKIYFGETAVVGNEDVEARYIRRLLEWKPGKLVTPERLRTTQLNLIETGLFNSVRVEPGKKAGRRGPCARAHRGQGSRTQDDRGRRPLSHRRRVWRQPRMGTPQPARDRRTTRFRTRRIAARLAPER